MKITQDVHRNVATIHDSAGAGASGNGSNGQALTADMRAPAIGQQNLCLRRSDDKTLHHTRKWNCLL
jgi:hypothetical protein